MPQNVWQDIGAVVFSVKGEGSGSWVELPTVYWCFATYLFVYGGLAIALVFWSRDLRDCTGAVSIFLAREVRYCPSGEIICSTTLFASLL